jgi:hypothetical protein
MFFTTMKVFFFKRIVMASMFMLLLILLVIIVLINYGDCYWKDASVPVEQRKITVLNRDVSSNTHYM